MTRTPSAPLRMMAREFVTIKPASGKGGNAKPPGAGPGGS